MVITDSVFSADGVLAPLRQLYEVCRRHGALLIVDEAHGLGVRGTGGRGLLEEAGLAGAPDVVMTVTMSKALGSQGGAVLGPVARARSSDRRGAPVHLRHRTGACRGGRGVGGAAGADGRAVAGAGGSSTLRRAGPGVRSSRPAGFRGGFGDSGRSRGRGGRGYCLLDRGVRVGCFRPPTVPVGTSRLRLTARASLSDDEMTLARECSRKCCRRA